MSSIPLSIPVAILAGGLATRLRPLTEHIPKSLLMVAGRPFLAHQLELLHHQGIQGDIPAGEAEHPTAVDLQNDKVIATVVYCHVRDIGGKNLADSCQVSFKDICHFLKQEERLNKNRPTEIQEAAKVDGSLSQRESPVKRLR